MSFLKLGSCENCKSLNVIIGRLDLEIGENKKTICSRNEKVNYLSENLCNSEQKIQELKHEISCLKYQYEEKQKENKKFYENFDEQKKSFDNEKEKLCSENEKLKQLLKKAEVEKTTTINSFLHLKTKLSDLFDVIRQEEICLKKDDSVEIISQNLDKIKIFLAEQKSMARFQIEKKLFGDKKDVFKKDDPFKLYDVIISINFFRDLVQKSQMKQNGWKIIMNPDKSKKILKSVVVSVLGNYNKGKTWLLSLLSGRELPIGYNVHTKGISCIYANDPNKPITFNDSEGFEVPIRSIKYTRKIKNAMQEEQKNDIEEFVYPDLKHMFKDKQYIEHFMQRFLLDCANVILIVVNQLTFADQRLINRIISDFEEKKRIFVVHNFSNLCTVEDVSKYIQRDIKDSFEVEEIVFAGMTDIDSTFNNVYYKNLRNPGICHIVFARDESQAGKLYNRSSTRILLNCIAAESNQKEFHLEISLQNYLNSQFRNYFENQTDFKIIKTKKKETSEPTKYNSDFESTSDVKLISCSSDTSENNSPDKYLKSREMEYLSIETSNPKLEFKPSNMDELGYLKLLISAPNSLSLPYAFYQTQDKYIFEIEIPGLTKDMKSQIKIKPENSVDGFHFIVEGIKPGLNLEQNYNPVSTLQHGKVDFQTSTLSDLEVWVSIRSTSPIKEIENGILRYSWAKNLNENKEY